MILLIDDVEDQLPSPTVISGASSWISLSTGDVRDGHPFLYLMPNKLWHVCESGVLKETCF